jgi:hypothetical protein
MMRRVACPRCGVTVEQVVSRALGETPQLDRRGPDLSHQLGFGLSGLKRLTTGRHRASGGGWVAAAGWSIRSSTTVPAGASGWRAVGILGGRKDARRQWMPERCRDQ